MNLIRSTLLKPGLAALLAALLMQPALAGEARALPQMALFDAAGLVVDTPAPQQPGRWVLLVLDAGMASSQSLLSTLARRTDGYGDRLVVIVSGPPARATSFAAANEKLPGVRWLMDPERAAGAALRLSTTPVLLALDDHNRIAWQLAGPPKRGSVEAMVLRWLAIPPPAM